jgi:hypothetical protein
MVLAVLSIFAVQHQRARLGVHAVGIATIGGPVSIVVLLILAFFHTGIWAILDIMAINQIVPVVVLAVIAVFLAQILTIVVLAIRSSV